MANKHNIILGMLILQLYVSAAPSDISKLGDIAQVDETEPKLDSELYGIAQEAKADENSTQSARQKRFYNYYGYGVPPFSSLIYPNIVKRDESSDTAVYGAEDPFVQIHKRLKEIIEFARQPAPMPVPSQIPIFFPVIYIPQGGCNCNSDTNNVMTEKPSVDNNGTTPDVNTRLPEMDETDDDEDDFIRPISFDPVTPKQPLRRPPPPVEHGSSQADAESSTGATEGLQSIPAQEPQSTPALEPQSTPALESQSSLNELSTDPEPPSSCDGAILSCCHQPQVTYECFGARGCPNPTSYGNPCDAYVILQVINKYQKYYGQRNG